MARNPMPTPSADPYSSYNTDKNKKKKQTAGGVKTVTPPPQPAHSTSPTPSATRNCEQPVPQPPKVTTTATGAQSTYNPLTIKQNTPSSPSIADTIQSKPSVYDSVPIPQTFVGGNKLPKQNSSTYTVPIQTDGYTASKAAKSSVYGQSVSKTNYSPNRETAQYMSTATYQPKQNKSNSVYQPKNRYYEKDPYVSKDRVTDYSTPKPQNVNNSYTNTDKPKETVQTVKAGRSDIRIRDNGNTIRFESDTSIDLFDFLDYLNGNYGLNNEMAESVNKSKPTEPDLIAGAAPYQSVQGKPVMKYENMVRPPDEEYRKKDEYWYSVASNNRDFYLKAKEIDVMNKNPDKYYLYLNKLWNIKKIAEESKIKVYSYNENESDENNKNKPYSVEEANVDGTKPNTFQHMMWSALLSEQIGAEEAYIFTTAHETYTNEQYDKGALYNQDDVGRIVWKRDNIAYPTRQQHAAMDLHNNNLGIIIERQTPVEQTEIIIELEEMLGTGETISELKRYYPDLTLRQILIMKKIIKSIEDGEAAIIWDKNH